MLIDGLDITGGWFFIITIMLTPGVFLALAVAAIIFLGLTGKLAIRLHTEAIQLGSRLSREVTKHSINERIKC